MQISIHSSTESTIQFEMVEKKGLGHPDTICDEIAEAVSVALSQYYLEQFGSIMHHNVDKALLVGGRSAPQFNGGKILVPMELFIAGRATSEVKGKIIPVEKIAIETARDWMSNNLRYFKQQNNVIITPKIRSGSKDLVALFQRFGKGEVPLANDTSFGVGYYPNSELEMLVLKADHQIRLLQSEFPCIGEDTKVMGVRRNGKKLLTIAIAMVDQYIESMASYISQIKAIQSHLASTLGLDVSDIFINTADDYQKESIYLTVTGCSAENGDDGQVGRGNRINGLITPYRPMSLEATAGKNPISHVGKIYNLWAQLVAREICQQSLAASAEIFIVSQIGKPINQPTLLDIRIQEAQQSEDKIRSLIKEKLQEMPFIWKQLLTSDHPFEPFSEAI